MLEKQSKLLDMLGNVTLNSNVNGNPLQNAFTF